MEYRTLGRTGLKVSTHCLGTMMFGAWGGTTAEESIPVIHAALDAGINFIDTADVYSAGESEEITGKAIAGRRDEIVLATKVHGPMGTGPNERGNSRVWIMREVENSLRRLGTGHIDLYQMHRPDPATDIEETLSALTDLVRQGKIRHAGISTFQAWQIVESHWVSERRGLERFVCEQPQYSIFVRAAERDVFPVTQRYGMGVIVWSPLAGGWLAGRYRDGVPDDSRFARAAKRGSPVAASLDPKSEQNAAKAAAVESLAKIASDAGMTLTHLSMAFAVEHPAVTSAIIGPRTREQLDDLIAASEVRLDAATLDAIDEVVLPGEIIDGAGIGWTPPWLDASERRRPVR